MTTIAVKVDREQGIIQIAADNQITSYECCNEASGFAVITGIKLLELSNGWIFAMTGSIGEMNLFREAAKIVSDHSGPEPARLPNYRTEIGALTKFLKECYGQYLGDPGYCHDSLSMLAIVNGKAYQVASRYGVLEVNAYMALGSGCAYAMAAMHLGFDAVAAVKCAAEFDLFTDDRVSSRIVKMAGDSNG